MVVPLRIILFAVILHLAMQSYAYASDPCRQHNQRAARTLINFLQGTDGATLDDFNEQRTAYDECREQNHTPDRQQETERREQRSQSMHLYLNNDPHETNPGGGHSKRIGKSCGGYTHSHGSLSEHHHTNRWDRRDRTREGGWFCRMFHEHS